ncbi:MAG: alpha/beta hydrolase [Anaerolineales bacterium]|nr:alpha/beta hydrolase [Anaerolineales bacterium]
MEKHKLPVSTHTARTEGTNSRVTVQAVRGVNGTLAYRQYRAGIIDDSIVLLHGLGSAGVDWSLQTAELVHRYRVITIDLPGHGESPPSNHRSSIPELSRQVLQTLDGLHTKPCILVGHSLGGITALQMVLDQPDRFRALVLVNAVPHMSVSRHSIRQGMGRLPDVLLGRMDMLAGFVAAEHFPHPGQDLLRRLAVRRIGSVERQTYLHMMTAILRFDVRGQLGRISKPVLVVSGTDDRVFSSSDKQVLAEKLPDVTWVEMEESGHACPQDSPVRFNRILWSFLDQLDSPEETETSEYN